MEFTTHITAVRYIQTAETGSSQPSLVEASDGLLYWVKSQGNPQGTRVLINEMMANRLAARVGLPVAPFRLIVVSKEFIERNSGFHYRRPNHYGVQKPFPGLQFASSHVPGVPSAPAARDRCAEEFAGGFVFDIWTRQRDRRQAAFTGSGVRFYDYGMAFAPQDLEFPLTFDDGGRAPYSPDFDYGRFTRMSDFEPWLSRIEALSLIDIAQSAVGIPKAWFEARSVWDRYALSQGEFDATEDDLRRRIGWLYELRTSIREDVEAEIAASEDIFSSWAEPFSEAALSESARRREVYEEKHELEQV